MEIRPSWWIEGMNQLMHDDESPPVEFPYSYLPPVPASKIQAYAAELTEKCLRRGPCYECPLSITPLAFDVSLRTFAVYPFAVYPVINADMESDG
ncbi:hypothetical protein EXIGLDRAFT_722950 [Exidia glandulosa HHB12029]|uniref:Uncharacterized protein n=1 Tax=Exidia glandulosa HHB12029 TaxID=1314781 RepID=A0A166A3K2_EXIGL|nr:hypothetical protein EXIGLDRAFT_722950 [Exidia glandulosa HHB12029]